MAASVSSPEGRTDAVSTIEDVTWLNDVREVRHSVDFTHPLIVRRTDVRTGPPLPQPTVPYPEKHPYCEFGFNLEGRFVQYIGGEKIERNTGDVMLIGPGTPHYAMLHSYPQCSITIHFLPILLFEMGPDGDGARVLARFTTPQKIASRVVRPPVSLTREFGKQFKRMAIEFENKKFGWELCLRGLLMNMLVDLMRWEDETGVVTSRKPETSSWIPIEKALRYMHEHFADPLYIEQIARAVGLSVGRLQVTFREALGMNCVHYLRALRICHAKTMLCAPDARVTEVAFRSGFETLSHFNTSFRSLVGMSPTEYVRSTNRRKRS